MNIVERPGSGWGADYSRTVPSRTESNRARVIYCRTVPTLFYSLTDVILVTTTSVAVEESAQLEGKMQFSKHVPMLLCSNVPEAAHFYRTHLGLAVTADIGWFVSMTKEDMQPPFELSLCASDHDTVPREIRMPASGTVLAFMVDDVKSVYARFVNEGLGLLTDVLDEPWGQRHFYVAAPDGVALDIFQPISPDPAWMTAHGFG